MINAKNRLQEYFQRRGERIDWHQALTHVQLPGGAWQATLQHVTPDGRTIAGVGVGPRKSDADVLACEEAMNALGPEPHDGVWTEAQAGDALIKLAIHATRQEATPAERTDWLRDHESESALARVFEAWADAGDPDVAELGPECGQRRKATLVEALIWRRFRDRVLGPDAEAALEAIVSMLEGR